MQKKYLYVTFALLLACTVAIVVLLYKYISIDTVDLNHRIDDEYRDKLVIPNDQISKDSWMYKIYLQKKQNKFSYPRTVYHINLN